MMTPLENMERQLGGKTRADNQTGADRKFLATLAASRRPLLHDVNKSDDELLKDFRELSKNGPDRTWIIFVIVGADGRTIRSTLSNEIILRRLKLVGGAIGFLGLTLFGSPGKANRSPSLQLYYKPLKKGNGVIEKLNKVGREFMAFALANIQPIQTAPKTEVGE